MAFTFTFLIIFSITNKIIFLNLFLLYNKFFYIFFCNLFVSKCLTREFHNYNSNWTVFRHPLDRFKEILPCNFVACIRKIKKHVKVMWWGEKGGRGVNLRLEPFEIFWEHKLFSFAFLSCVVIKNIRKKDIFAKSKRKRGIEKWSQLCLDIGNAFKPQW